MKKALGIVVLALLTLTVNAQQSIALKIGSYNIRYDNQGDRNNGDGWDKRYPVITSIIRWESPDVFGAQEVLVHQLRDMSSLLTDFDYYGIGRDDGKEKGEYAPIFFKKDKFQLLQEGTFWLSETPDKPSKGWDAALPRICSWVHLKENSSGKTFWFFNLHMDHIGKIARKQSSYLVLKKIKEMAGSDPAFLTGDFNVDQHDSIYNILAQSKYLADAFTIAKDKMAWNGTFNAFDTGLWTDSRIDHVYVTSGVLVSDYAVLTESYRSKHAEDKEVTKGDFPKELSFKRYDVRLPSDHFPVFCRIRF